MSSKMLMSFGLVWAGLGWIGFIVVFGWWL
jgi:hypothetical protein